MKKCKIVSCGDKFVSKIKYLGIGLLSYAYIQAAQAQIIDIGFSNALGSGFANAVLSVASQEDGKILAGGSFATLNGQAVPARLVRLNNDGTIDNAFTNSLGSGFNQFVAALALQTDGKIVVGGNFTTLDGNDVPDRFVRLNSNGTLDNAFTNALGSGFDGPVAPLLVQADGKILVAGNFTMLNGQSIPAELVRLNEDGTLDTVFTNALGSGFMAAVEALAEQEDGKIVVGGNFTTLNGNDVPDRLIRLNTNGTLDVTFTNALGSGFDNDVLSLAVQEDGKILVGGDFTTLNGQNVPQRLIRLNGDGTLDTAFTNALGSGLDNIVSSLALQRDKKILVGGDFTTLNGQSVPQRLIRLNSDGSLDTTFTNALGSGLDNSVFSLAIQQDGKTLVGGDFTTLNTQNIPHRLVRLNPIELLTNIVINPINPSILTNTIIQFFATGQYSEGQISNLTDQVNWTSSDPLIATINTNGLASGLSAGVTTIRASLYGITNETALTVTNLSGGGAGQQTLADFNGDGRDDILLQKKTALSILTQSGSNATFSVVDINTPLSKGQKIVAANDLDGDSLPEIIIKKGKNYSVMNVSTNLDIGTSGYTLPTLSKGFKIKGSGQLGSNAVIVSSKKKTIELLGNNGLKGSLIAKGYKAIGVGNVGSGAALVLVKGKSLNQAAIQLSSNQINFGDINPIGDLPKKFKAVGLGQIVGSNGVDVIIQKGKEIQALTAPTFTTPSSVGTVDKGQKGVGPR